MVITSYQDPRTIFVVGGTGAQGMPVIRALLAPGKDGTPSFWQVRMLTRDPTHHRAKELEKLGAELVQGDFMNFDVIREGMKGCYGVFANTDGFTVGEMAETYAGVKIFQIAKQSKIRHYVWSSLDNFNITATITWRKLLSQWPLFAPIKKRPDGTFVFAAPMNDGHIPMIALEDLAFWVRHIFDDPKSSAGKDLEVASAMVSYSELVETFTRVTGAKAEYKRLSMDEWFALWTSGKEPIASALTGGTTTEQNFRGFWASFRDDIVCRDMDWIRTVHPETTSLEKWIRDHEYDGRRTLLHILMSSEASTVYGVSKSESPVMISVLRFEASRNLTPPIMTITASYRHQTRRTR